MKRKSNIDEEAQKRILDLSDEELIKAAFIESPKYREEIVQFAISEVKKRGLAELPVKHCPNCERPVHIEQDICACGYNFKEPNMELIEKVKTKRFRKNQIGGLVMVIIGIIWYFIFLSSTDVSEIGKHSMDKFIYGIPSLLIIFGLYKIFFGSTLKKPTKSPFDNILGDSAHEKDESDDLSYIFCPQCKNQILIELEHKQCPNCGYNLKPIQEKKRVVRMREQAVIQPSRRSVRKKIAWIAGLLLISILAYFALQIGSVAKESLHLAATKGDIDTLKLLIKSGKDVNAETPMRLTPLHLAAMQGHKEVVEILLANGANIDPQEKKERRTPLDIAASMGHKEVVELLLVNGADVNARATANTTPLHVAIMGGHERIVELLLANGADVTILADDKYTPLQLAEMLGKRDVVELLKK